MDHAAVPHADSPLWCEAPPPQPASSPAAPAAAPAFTPAAADASAPFQGLYDAPVDITAVDDSDVVGLLSAVFRAGETSGFRSADEMIDGILALAAGRPIRTLDILDHGSPGAQQMGQQTITPEALQLPELRASLGRLRGHFAKNGRVDLGGCRVALGPQGERLLRELAKIWGVPVRGGFPYQRPLIPGMEGSVMTCDPPTVDENGTEVQVCRTEPHPTADDVWGTK